MHRIGKLAVVATALTAFAGGAQAQEVVQWWDFLSGGDGVRMKALLDEFNQTHEGEIQIEATTLEWGTPFYTKLQTSAAIGQGPDIATYHLSRIPLAVDAGTLAPITDEDMAAMELSDEDFTEAAVAASKVDGTRYAVPFDQHALILYYNKDILEEAGMLDENGEPTVLGSREDFEAALAELTEGDQYGLTTPTGDTFRVVYSYFGQLGGDMYSPEEGFFPGDNVDKLATATALVNSWVENGWTPRQIEGAASLATFTSGNAAFMMVGNWEVPTMTDLAAAGELFDWSATEIPVIFDQPAAWSDSHAFVIPANAGQEPSPEKHAAVLEVISWMSENSLSWATAGHLPANNAIRESEEFAAMEPQSNYAGVAETAIFDPPSVLSGPAAPLGDAWTNYIVPAVTGDIPPEEAAQQMKEDLNSQL